MTAENLLRAHRLTLYSPAGRLLFRDLTLLLSRGERVALVGRNGVGKSTLLRALAGEIAPESGALTCFGERRMVAQVADSSSDRASSLSAGQARRRDLQTAFDASPDLLLLDEPTHDLDQAGQDWLAAALQRWRNGLIVVSHSRRLLRGFHDFFVVAEAGCQHFNGSFDALIDTLSREQAQQEQRYVSHLHRLANEEKHNHLIAQRRQRKKNVGRIRELRRCPNSTLLNSKRSYAQEKQAKRMLIQQDRIETARRWAAAARRALAVELPLEAVLPTLPPPLPAAATELRAVSARAGARVLFSDLSLSMSRQRMAVTGANGAGKTTLLELLAGERHPQSGTVRNDPQRIGYIAQNGANWRRPESLLQLLVHECHASPELAASRIHAHKFPLALSERPLGSLSPGERLRAALICLLQRRTPPELLILDEPTCHLDFPGYASLQHLLSRWPGGLVVASHDDEFLTAIGLDARIELGRAPAGPP